MHLTFNKIEHRVLNIANIPVLMIICDVLRGITDGIGTIETIIMLAYCLYSIIFIKKILLTNYWITIFLFYALILAFFSSNSIRTFQNYSWVFISLMMFPIAFHQIKTVSDLKKLNYSIFLLIIIFAVNGVLTSTMGIGVNPYGGTFVMGAFVFSVLLSGSVALIILPLILSDFKNPFLKIITIISSIVLYALLFLSLRRTAIIIPLIGYFVYFFYSSFKKKIIVGLIGTIMLLVVTFPLYQKILLSQIAARDNIFNETYELEEEGRFIEGGVVMNERLANYIPWGTALFGKEVFNEYGKYRNGFFGDRQIHVDYYKIIYTLGIIGLFLYLMIFVDIWTKFNRYKKFVPKETYYKEMRGIFVSLFIISFLISFSSGMLTVTFRSMLFIYFGAILGVFSRFWKDQLIIENSQD